MKINPFAVMQEEVDHTGIVFNPDNNRVMTLNKSGVVLWKAFENNLSIAEAAALLVENFDGITLPDAQRDAEKFAALNIPVVQLHTDGACHIEAMSIQLLLKEFDLANLDVIFVENIGNLVCPAEFNIGESFRLALLSIPEGDDKVEKYPLMFATSHALAMNKYDLKEYFGFDDERVERSARGINPEIQIFRVSSRDGLGLDELTGWISRRIDDTIAKS